MVCILECVACSTCNSVKRIFADVELNVHLLRKAFCKSAQLGAAAGKPDTVLYDIGIELGRSVLKHVQDGRFYLGDGLIEAVGNLLMSDSGLDGVGGQF